jgi:acetyl-CoA acetyltransferase
MPTSLTDVVVIGAAEARYQRHPHAEVTTESLLADAAIQAVRDAQLDHDEIDGLAVASFTLAPDHAIDLAWRLGLRLRWLMEDTNGGASGVNMLQHAARAVQTGDAKHVLLVAGDRMGAKEFALLADGYNAFTRDHLAPLPLCGPNTLFSFLTQRHMEEHSLRREDYGYIAIAQRRWAELNPGAVYRQPLTMDEYLAAPQVAPPLCRYDCVPVVSGADAIVVSSADVVGARRGVELRAIAASYNWDQQEGDGLKTGLAAVAADFWRQAGCGPDEVDLACLYDDYPVVVMIQLADLGFVPDGDLARFTRERLFDARWPLNTSGGMLSAGQAGAGGGLHGLVEAATQLLNRANGRQVDARRAIVSGYGMVLARYGACANVALLERTG